LAHSHLLFFFTTTTTTSVAAVARTITKKIIHRNEVIRRIVKNAMCPGPDITLLDKQVLQAKIESILVS
jgi:hypothetical protein